jgi:MoaA/NifB/PqqE/SkfB family radical SAM enzyme
MRIINLFKSRFITHSPFRLVHDITYQCNCKCIICERWKKSSKSTNHLSTTEIFEMLEDGKNAGLQMYVAEGGEPLFRNDLPDVLEFAKKLKYDTSVVTNGYFLKNRYNEILPFTDSLIISIDSNDELHDKMRGLNGLLKRTFEGINLCKNETKIIINSVLCKRNVDKIEGLVKLSDKLNIPMIIQPMDIYSGYNEELLLTDKELKKSFTKIIDMKNKGYPILNSYRYLRTLQNKKIYDCHAPKCYTYVEPNGNIVSCCDLIDKVWGNVKHNKFKDIFKSREFKDFCKKHTSCNKCNIYSVVAASLSYSLNPLKKF